MDKNGEVRFTSLGSQKKENMLGLARKKGKKEESKNKQSHKSLALDLTRLSGSQWAREEVVASAPGASLGLKRLSGSFGPGQEGGAGLGAALVPRIPAAGPLQSLGSSAIRDRPKPWMVFRMSWGGGGGAVFWVGFFEGPGFWGGCFEGPPGCCNKFLGSLKGIRSPVERTNFDRRLGRRASLGKWSDFAEIIWTKLPSNFPCRPTEGWQFHRRRIAQLLKGTSCDPSACRGDCIRFYPFESSNPGLKSELCGGVAGRQF